MKRVVKTVVVGTLVGLLSAGAAGAYDQTSSGMSDVSCAGQSDERPYVCDIGPAEPLSMASFVQLLQDDNALRATVARIGMPDAAELQRVRVNEPWVSYEVRTYYRDYDRMYVFGRAFILNNPQITLLRHEGPIPAAWYASRAPIDAEAEARRAEDAAARAESIADRAERLADRAEAIADAMAEDFPRRLQKN